MGAARSMRILTIGLSADARQVIFPHLRKAEEINFSVADDLKKWITSGDGCPYDAVFAGRGISEIAPNEIAQLIRMKAPTTPAMFVSLQDERDQVSNLRKNGFDNVYSLPVEETELRLKINQIADEWTAAIRRDGWVPVGVCEIEANTELEFAVALFLKLNNKIVMVANKGDKMDASRLARIREHGTENVMISRLDLQAYTSYSARRLWELTQSSPVIPDDVRREKLHRTIRTLINGLFHPNHLGFAASEEQRRQATEIVSRFVVKANPPSWLLEFIKQPSDLNHSAGKMNLTSTLAGLFAIGLEMENVANVVAASMFQDLGLADSELTNPLSIHHPEASVQILRQRWDLAPQSVCRAIAEHHENWDGSGFPYQLKGDQISQEAQVLSLANQFTSALSDKRGDNSLNSILASIDQRNWIQPSLLKSIAQIIQEPGARS